MAEIIEDQELVRRISTGDEGAMQTLYLRHHQALLAFLMVRNPDKQIAIDSLQDAMLEVWRTASRFGGYSSVRTWIFAIARNKQVDHFRRNARLTFTENVPETIDPAPNPEMSAISASDAERVQNCLLKLTVDHRTVIRLAFFEDMTYAEIAEVEGIPEGTVKTRIFHAKRHLRHCLC